MIHMASDAGSGPLCFEEGTVLLLIIIQPGSFVQISGISLDHQAFDQADIREPFWQPDI